MAMVESALWLIVFVPQMYIQALHIDYGIMSVVSWVGLLGLIGGLYLGLRSKRKGLLWFFVPVLFAHFYLLSHLGLTSLLQSVWSSETTDYVSLVFAVIEISILFVMFIRLKGARVPASMLAVFSGSYAFTAIAIAYM